MTATEYRQAHPVETFEAVAFGHTGAIVERAIAPSPKGAEAEITRILKGRACDSIVVRGEFTSDGTWWAHHLGRVVSVWNRVDGWRSF